MIQTDLVMFPDSDIAKNYHQVATKINYNIQFGIASYIKECLLYIVSHASFLFKFDETTTYKVDKQDDVCMQYWSKKSNLVNNGYCGSFFVGHCIKEDLLENFNHFIKKMNCNNPSVLHLGINGRSMNLTFQKRL